MSHAMENEMRLFESATGQGGAMRPPRPHFLPSSVRSQVPPPPPAFARPPITPRGPGLPATKSYAPGQVEYVSPAVISKPAVHEGDDDVLSTLMKYEKEVRAQKREKKHFEKKKKELGLDGGVSMLKPAPPPVVPAMP